MRVFPPLLNWMSSEGPKIWSFDALLWHFYFIFMQSWILRFICWSLISSMFGSWVITRPTMVCYTASPISISSSRWQVDWIKVSKVISIFVCQNIPFLSFVCHLKLLIILWENLFRYSKNCQPVGRPGAFLVALETCHILFICMLSLRTE